MTKERKATDTAVMIVSMHGEPDYAGKVGRVLYTDDAGHVHGTWGGCALIPGEDVYVERNLFEELKSMVGETRAKAEAWTEDLVRTFDGTEDEDLLISWAEEMESAGAFLREMLCIQKATEEATSFNEALEGLKTPLLKTLNDEIDSLRMSDEKWIQSLILSEIGRIARERH